MILLLITIILNYNTNNTISSISTIIIIMMIIIIMLHDILYPAACPRRGGAWQGRILFLFAVFRCLLFLKSWVAILSYNMFVWLVSTFDWLCLRTYHISSHLVACLAPRSVARRAQRLRGYEARQPGGQAARQPGSQLARRGGQGAEIGSGVALAARRDGGTLPGRAGTYMHTYTYVYIYIYIYI